MKTAVETPLNAESAAHSSFTCIPAVTPANFSSKTAIAAFGRQESYPETLPAKSRTTQIPFKTADFAEVIVINAGSHLLKIGRYSDLLPKVLPHCLARRIDIEGCDAATANENVFRFQNDNDEFFSASFEKLFAARMATLKRKPMPNAPSHVHNFNSNAEPHVIPDHNDPHSIEWTAVDDGTRNTFYAAETKTLPNADGRFALRYPLRHGTFNRADYTSIHAVLDDLNAIWTHVLRENLHIERSMFGKCAVLLVLPDAVAADGQEVCYFSRLLFDQMGFGAAAFLQESVASVFAGGWSSGVVLNLGNQTIGVAAVEDGYLLPESRVRIPWGGENLAKLFYEFLMDAAFPFDDCDCRNQPLDYDLITELKNNALTLVESDTFNVSTFEIYIRKPAASTLHYNVKMYEERIMTPLALFTPQTVPLFERENAQFQLPFASDEESVGNGGECTQSSQQTQTAASDAETDFLPLDAAAFRSIAACVGSSGLQAAEGGSSGSGSTLDRCKRLASSLLLVGGDSCIPGLGAFLQARLQPLLSDAFGVDAVGFVKMPRDLDPIVVPWKGAAVFAKMDAAADAWITATEWAFFGFGAVSSRVNFLMRK